MLKTQGKALKLLKVDLMHSRVLESRLGIKKLVKTIKFGRNLTETLFPPKGYMTNAGTIVGQNNLELLLGLSF